MRAIVAFLFVASCLFALSPTKVIKADGNVIDIIYENSHIFVGTDNGHIEIYDINSSKLKEKIAFTKIKDFSGELINPKIFSIDKIKNEELFLAVVQGESFYRKLFLIKNSKPIELIELDKKLMIKKAKFIDKEHILIALISNEIILFNVQNKKFIYKKQLSQSQFSDFSLTFDKDKAALSEESGVVNILNTKNGKIITKLEDGNVDNIYKIDFKNGKVLTAGQDRRAILYDVKSKQHERYNASFLIYACALSKSAKYGAFAINQDNDIAVFNFQTKEKIATLKGQKSTLNSIVFIDDTHLVSGSDDKYIMIWSLK